MCRVLMAMLLAAAVVPRALEAADTDQPGTGPATVVLDANSPWRCFLMWKTLQVKRASGDLQFMEVSRGKPGPAEAVRQTPAPPADWTAVAFDDTSWSRVRPPLFARRTQEIALICLRGVFTTADPALLGDRPLTVSLTYRGGAVVSVNGTELGRAHLPDGRITPDTPAEAYPDEAFVTPAGSRLRWIGFGEPEQFKDRFAMRDRTLHLRIPASALRKGGNVLAVEVHRPPTSQIYFTSRVIGDPIHSEVDLCSIEAVTLEAPRGSGITPNTAPPTEARLFNWPVAAALTSIDHADPHEAVRPIVISGVRNGAFSGQIVVGCGEGLKGVKAVATDLTGPGGAAIPAAAVRVRYALTTDGTWRGRSSSKGRPLGPDDQRGVRRFEALLDDAPDSAPVLPPARGAVQPIWVTVSVPRDAPPGDYAGTLTVSANGRQVGAVPIRLSVADWVLPDPQHFDSFMGLVQSPDSVAAYYKVPFWSDEHWRLLERSFDLLGQVGTKDVYILARGKTYFGNEHSMIRWIRKADGAWDHDFSIVERYLDLAVKYLGKPPVVAVYCWDVDAGSTYFGRPIGDQHANLIEDRGTPFTVLDPKTGALSEERSPKWTDPKAKSFWQPVFDSLRAVLAKRGLEGSMMVGLTPDKRPLKETVTLLREVSGGAPWISHAHPYMNQPLFGTPVGYFTTVWGAGRIPDPAEARYYGWRTPHLAAVFPRFKSAPCGDGLRNNSAPLLYRMAMERSLLSSAGLRGVGRCGADFFSVYQRGHSGRLQQTQSVLGRYEETSHWHGGWIWYAFDHVLAPGPDGAVATVRFEMLREGIQEAEARIFLERALTDPAKKARLGDALAARAQTILDERVRDSNRAMTDAGGGLPFTWYAGAGTPRRGSLPPSAKPVPSGSRTGAGAGVSGAVPLLEAVPPGTPCASTAERSADLYAVAADVAARLK